MPGQGTPVDGSQAIGSPLTDNPVNGLWRVGARRRLRRADRPGGEARGGPFVRPSPHATPLHHVVLQADVPVRQRVGLRRVPRPATVTRVFRRFTPTAIPAMVEPRWTWGLDRLPLPAGETPLDASVFERSGTQEGALKGDTPTTYDRRPRRPGAGRPHPGGPRRLRRGAPDRPGGRRAGGPGEAGTAEPRGPGPRRRGRRGLLPARRGDRGRAAGPLPPVHPGRGVPAAPGIRSATDARPTQAHPLRVWGEPGGGGATAGPAASLAPHRGRPRSSRPFNACSRPPLTAMPFRRQRLTYAVNCNIWVQDLKAASSNSRTLRIAEG